MDHVYYLNAMTCDPGHHFEVGAMRVDARMQIPRCSLSSFPFNIRVTQIEFYRIAVCTCLHRISLFFFCEVIGAHVLTHWGRATHICVSKLTITGSDNGLSALSHYLSQCWAIVNLTIRNKLQWNINRNSHTFIQENAFENVVCEISVILSRPWCVNELGRSRSSLL